MTPGFWYDFLTGPALGGIGALLAAIIVATVTWSTSKKKQAGAAREEWFRRVQWAQQLTADDNEHVQNTGFLLLIELANSSLATKEDWRLVYGFFTTERLEEEDENSAETLDDTEYVVDTEISSSSEADEEAEK